MQSVTFATCDGHMMLVMRCSGGWTARQGHRPNVCVIGTWTNRSILVHRHFWSRLGFGLVLLVKYCFHLGSSIVMTDNRSRKCCGNEILKHFDLEGSCNNSLLLEEACGLREQKKKCKRWGKGHVSTVVIRPLAFSIVLGHVRKSLQDLKVWVAGEMTCVNIRWQCACTTHRSWSSLWIFSYESGRITSKRQLCVRECFYRIQINHITIARLCQHVVVK
jgi:hypothetical protein